MFAPFSRSRLIIARFALLREYDAASNADTDFLSGPEVLKQARPGGLCFNRNSTIGK